MSQKGYFSGKTEYDRSSGNKGGTGKSGNSYGNKGNYGSKGGSGKPGGYGNKNDSNRGGYGNRDGYGKPNSGYDSQGGYGSRDDDSKPDGYRGKSGGYSKPGGSYGKGGGDRKPGGGYDNKGGYGSRDNDGKPGGYRGKNDSNRGGYGNRDGYSKPNSGYDSQGGYGSRDNDEKPGGYRGKSDSDRSNYVNKGSYGKPGGSYGKGGGDRKPGGGYDNKGGYGSRDNDGKPGGYRGKNDFNRGNYDNKGGGQRDYHKKDAYDRTTGDSRPYSPAPDAPDMAQQNQQDELPFLIIGRNAVREAVKAGRSIDRILVSAEPDGSLREIVSLARDRKILVRETSRKALDELCMPFGHGNKTANHQGIVGYAAGVSYCSVQDILDHAKEKNEPPFVIVLDNIMDPHNLGSIIRSAECAGAHGVIIGKRRSASVTAATVKAAAGATEYVPIARVTNVIAAIGELKKAGLWIAGADMAGKPMAEQNLSGPLALVIGSEGEGLGKLVQENCDYLAAIPISGKLDSLNASVAAGVLMFEKRRQDAAALVAAKEQ